jgi:ABC-type sugar transport system substrate-binding protein
MPKIKGFALFAATLLLPLGIAQAQTQAPQKTAPQQTVEQVPEQKLNQFAQALKMVAQLDAKYRPQIEKESNVDKRQKIAQQAQQEMIKAVNQVGLSVEEYNALTFKLQQDKAMQEKLQQKLQSL